MPISDIMIVVIANLFLSLNTGISRLFRRVGGLLPIAIILVTFLAYIGISNNWFISTNNSQSNNNKVDNRFEYTTYSGKIVEIYLNKFTLETSDMNRFDVSFDSNTLYYSIEKISPKAFSNGDKIELIIEKNSDKDNVKTISNSKENGIIDKMLKEKFILDSKINEYRAIATIMNVNEGKIEISTLSEFDKLAVSSSTGYQTYIKKGFDDVKKDVNVDIMTLESRNLKIAKHVIIK